MSLEVKCIFLHSGLLLSKIYFIKQTFVIKECVVFTCGPVSNEINHFHLISLCTDSYLTVCPGAGSVPRPGRERRRTRRYPLPSSSPHKPYRSLSKDTKRAPHSRRRKATPQPPNKPSRVKPSLPGREERSGAGRAEPALPRPPRPRCRPVRARSRGAGTRGAVCSFRAFSSPCKSPRVHGWLFSGPTMLQHIGLRFSRPSVLWPWAECAVFVSAVV